MTAIAVQIVAKFTIVWFGVISIFNSINEKIRLSCCAIGEAFSSNSKSALRFHLLDYLARFLGQRQLQL